MPDSQIATRVAPLILVAMSIVAYCNITRANAIRMLTEVEQAVSRWRDAGQAIGMTSAELEQFADAFQHSERDAAQKLAKAM